jgi:hypothetical protein
VLKRSESTLNFPRRLAVGAAIGALALVVTACTSGTSGTPKPTPTTSAASSSETSSTPPTGDSTTPDTSEPSTPTDSASTSTAVKTVTVIITNSGWDATAKQANANAIVPGTLVPSGSCTLTLSMGSVLRTATRAASTSGDSMQCGVMSIPSAQLTVGTWSATVRFDSATAAGISTAVTISVAG